MKFTVKTVSKFSGRLGILSKEAQPEKILETPLLLMQTKGGTIPHLSNEVLDLSLSTNNLLQINVSSTVHFQEVLQTTGKEAILNSEIL
jgi:queuine tRNA-ribosyltransferase subunit QTRTD1